MRRLADRVVVHGAGWCRPKARNLRGRRDGAQRAAGGDGDAGQTGGKGNEGVAGLGKQTPNALGYVELIYAIQNKLPYGLVQNQAGGFIKADLASVTEAAA